MGTAPYQLIHSLDYRAEAYRSPGRSPFIRRFLPSNSEFNWYMRFTNLSLSFSSWMSRQSRSTSARSSLVIGVSNITIRVFSVLVANRQAPRCARADPSKNGHASAAPVVLILSQDLSYNPWQLSESTHPVRTPPSPAQANALTRLDRGFRWCQLR